jgi:hypothetical protein
MTTMTLPGFTAADSLRTASERYSAARAADAMPNERIVPQRIPLCGYADPECVHWCQASGGGPACRLSCCEIWN